MSEEMYQHLRERIQDLLDGNELLRNEVAGTFQRVLELEQENIQLTSHVGEYRRLIETQNRLIDEHTAIVAKNGELEAENSKLRADIVKAEMFYEKGERMKIARMIGERDERIEELDALQEKHRTRILELDERCRELEMAGREMRLAQEAVRTEQNTDAVVLRWVEAEENFDALLATDHPVPDSSVAEHPSDKREVSGSIPDSATTDHQGER